jgi:hypothetical protein
VIRYEMQAQAMESRCGDMGSRDWVSPSADLGAMRILSANPGTSGSFHSNEEPTHEAGESPAREQAEDSGQFAGGGGQSNESQAHEATESPAHEAQENANSGTRCKWAGQTPSRLTARAGRRHRPEPRLTFTGSGPA